MKPRPTGFGAGAAAAAEVLVGGGCGGWAWRPRPRPATVASTAAMSVRGPGTTQAAAAASAVHSERHRGGVHGLQLPPLRLQFTADLEARIEKVIYACRFMTFLAIAGSLIGSVPCFLKGCVYVMDAFIEYYLHGGGKVTLMLVEAIDMFLVGTVMFVFGTGLYELFISNMDIAKSSSYGSNLFGLFRLPERPEWLEIQSVNDLKTKLGHVIVMVLLVGIFEKSKRVTITSCTDLFCFAASIFLSSACLYLLSRLSSK
ncbi:uncharacterized protein LOC127777465 [Oryza glaberrima]|uniref:Uncharacterized protein n=2 Tax=Oryza TaxID=4527 RepID=A0A0D3GKQ2_9ORYZ|nr:uncharacterized protein LOC127777465 [Oryza glaberrima]